MSRIKVVSINDENLKAQCDLLKISRYAFIPLVKINESKKTNSALIHTKSCARAAKKTLTLCDDFDEDKRKYTVPEIVVYLNTNAKIPLKIKRGYDPWGTQDSDGIVEFVCSNSAVKIFPKSKAANHGDNIEIEIQHSLNRGNEFRIDIYGKDEGSGTVGYSAKEVIGGSLKLKVIEQDVFRPDEVNSLLLENQAAQLFNQTGNVPGNGYCICAADRGLGSLLSNTTDFYNEPNTNNIRLDKSSTRAAVIDELGYINRSITIRTDRYNTNQAPTRLTTSLLNEIQSDIQGKMGYHVYYYSMLGEYHVMLLLINNTDPCNPLFSILDQGYVDDNDLQLNTIDQHFLDLITRFWGNRNHFAKNILLWKIQRA